jgi:hypothetical protein
VSECTTRTDSIGTPSTPDVSWANAVSWPWPCGEVPVLTVTVPSGCASTAANSFELNDVIST